MEKTEKKRSLLIVGAFAGALVYVGIFAATGTGLWGCPFRRITSFSCFGCGMTRSFKSIVYGDLPAAFDFHLLGPIFFVGFASVAIVHFIELIKGRRLEVAPVRFVRKKQTWFWGVFGIALILFGAVRFVSEVTAG